MSAEDTHSGSARRARRDGLLALLVTAAGGLAFTQLDASEMIVAALWQLEAFEVDDLLLTLVLAVCCTGWLAVRRHRESTGHLEALGAAERERCRYLERLETLSARLMSAEAGERGRIALLLHDEVSQPLYAARLRLDVMRGRTDDPSTHALLDETRAMIDHAMQQGRDLTSELSPPGLGDLPLVEALRALAERMQARYDVPMDIDASGPWSDLDPALDALIHGCVQELLVNAGKHARARRVTVSVTRTDGTALCLRVADDGEGFEPAARSGEGYGLLSVERRLARVDAHLCIRSRPGTGTDATIAFPEGAAAGFGGQAPQTGRERPYPVS